jgi:hypothetical protein
LSLIAPKDYKLKKVIIIYMEQVTALLKKLGPSQESIVGTSDNCLKLSKEKGIDEVIATVWSDELLKTTSKNKKLALIYLCNDIVQKSAEFDEGRLWKALKAKLNDHFEQFKPVKTDADRVLDIWQERKVYHSKDISTWKAVVSGQKPDDSLEGSRDIAMDVASTDSNGSSVEVYVPTSNCKELVTSLKTYKEWQKKVNCDFKEAKDHYKKVKEEAKRGSHDSEIALECKIGEMKANYL